MDILNLILLLGITAIPTILYMLVIKLTSPYKSIDLKTSLEYLGIGFGSLLFLFMIFMFMPFWSLTGYSPLYDDFLVTAPKEELVKLMGFMIIYKLTNRSKNSNPVSTMFYFGMVGLGFAMFENVKYALDFGPSILVSRFITATVAHMLFGMFFGYWIALSEIKYKKYTDRSVFGNLLYNSPKIKTIIFTVVGYLSAVIYHGIWNHNLSMSGGAAIPIMMLMVVFGLIGAKYGAKDLNDRYRKSLG